MSDRKSISAILSALKVCMSSRNLQMAKKIHADSIDGGCDLDLFVASTLVTVYAKCGSLVDACTVFHKMPHRDVVSWNNIILAHEENGEQLVALELFQRMQTEGFVPAARTFVAVFKACSSVADREDGKLIGDKLVKMLSLEKGMKLNAQAAIRGFVVDLYVSNTLVNMYAKCGSMLDARRTFDVMKTHDVVSWTALILGYAENGEADLALHVFAVMKARACRPNSLTFVAALKACVGLVLKEEGARAQGKLECFQKGMGVFSGLAACGLESEILVANTLMDMYFKCGRVVEGRAVFEWLPCVTVVSWTVLTLGYAENGEAALALDSFSRMGDAGCPPNSRTFIAALKACSVLAAEEDSKEVGGQNVKLQSLRQGVALHSLAAKHGCDSDIFLANTLIDMYSSCGSIVDASNVFHGMHRRTACSWNALMLGYCNNGQADRALSLFAEMSCAPDSVSFVAACKACASLAMKEEARKVDGRLVKTEALLKGLEIHFQAATAGCAGKLMVANTLVDMYMKCGCLSDARKVFERISPPSLVSWAVLIMGYAENGEGELALDLYHKCLRLEQMVLDAPMFVAALKACSVVAVKEEGTLVAEKLVKQKALKDGMEIHSQACKHGYGAHAFVTSALIDMYCKCGGLLNARQVFDELPCRSSPSWNALIFGYAESGEEEMALELFKDMKLQGAILEPRTFVAALRACTHLAAKEQGTQVDGKLVKLESLARGMATHSQARLSNSNGSKMDMFVCGALMDMYGKSCSMVDASRVFCKMENHDVVSWTSLMSGYAENGEPGVALELLTCMEAHGCAPNAPAFLVALKACASLPMVGALVGIYAKVCRSGLENSPVLETSLLHVYTRIGSMQQAQQAFDSMIGTKNVVAWNALINGYSRHGDSKQVFSWFQQMLDEKVCVDAITWTSVLSACSHAGLVDRGEKYFQRLCSKKLGAGPTLEHYHCMIDMVSRYNRLEAAVAMVKDMPWKATEVTWTIILGACCKWNNVAVGKVAFEAVQRLEGGPAQGAAFVLASNLISAKDEMSV